MAVENAPIGKKETRGIGPCQVCGNRAELESCPGDSRSMCGDCAEAIRRGMEKRRGPQEEAKVKAPTGAPAPPISEERQAYIAEIVANISPEEKKAVIQRLVEEDVFLYDFDRIIENDRWFTILDLRKLAAGVPKPTQKPSVPSTPKKIKGGKTNELVPA